MRTIRTASSSCVAGSSRSRPRTAGPAIEDRIDPPDQLLAVEDRQHVVAVLALRGRDVDLDPVPEPPELLGAVAVVDQPVERREQGRATANRAVIRLRMYAQLALV